MQARANWKPAKTCPEPLWEALRGQNISHQLIWTLQCFYHNQTGDVHHGAGDSRKFDTGGMDLGDDMFHLLDLRFADDVLTFANTKEAGQNFLDKFVRQRPQG